MAEKKIKPVDGKSVVSQKNSTDIKAILQRFGMAKADTDSLVTLCARDEIENKIIAYIHTRKKDKKLKT